MAGALATLPDRSIVVVDTFRDSVVYGVGEPTETELASLGSNEVAVARFDAEGSLLWARQSGGVGDDRGSAVAAHPDGSFVVTGRYTDEATFAMGEPQETVLSATGRHDMFLARYTPAGALDWVVGSRADPGGRIQPHAVGVLSGGSTIVTGTFHRRVVLGVGELNETSLLSVSESGSSSDMFLARYGPDGLLVWAVSAGAQQVDDGGTVVSATPDGAIVVGGFFEGTAIFGEGEPNQTSLSAPTAKDDAFLARFSGEGTLDWAVRAGTATLGSSPRVIGAAVEHDGSIILTGAMSGTTTFNPDRSDAVVIPNQGGHDVMFLARFDSSGGLRDVTRAAGTRDVRGKALAPLQDGSVVVVGDYDHTIAFGDCTLWNLQATDVFLARYE